MSDIYSSSTGTWTGDDASKSVSLGYTPKYVEINEASGGSAGRQYFKNSGMPSNTCLVSSTSGDKTISTGSLLTLSSDGFMFASSVNANGVTFNYNARR